MAGGGKYAPLIMPEMIISALLNTITDDICTSPSWPDIRACDDMFILGRVELMPNERSEGRRRTLESVILVYYIGYIGSKHAKVNKQFFNIRVVSEGNSAV